MSKIEIYLTNLGKYNEGYLVGQWVKLPIPSEQLKKVFEEIQIDGKEYEEYFIADVETDLHGIACAVSEYSSITVLNELAEKLDELIGYEEEKLQAVLEYESISDVDDIIQIIQSLDNFDLLADINDTKDLGYYYIDELGCLDVPEYLKNYIDYESYGRDVDMETSGMFTRWGYVIDNR